MLIVLLSVYIILGLIAGIVYLYEEHERLHELSLLDFIIAAMCILIGPLAFAIIIGDKIIVKRKE